jgi:hypothetical protein
MNLKGWELKLETKQVEDLEARKGEKGRATGMGTGGEVVHISSVQMCKCHVQYIPILYTLHSSLLKLKLKLKLNVRCVSCARAKQ